ncbi:hypothetical protein D9M68_317510 [compost metagenome]
MHGRHERSWGRRPEIAGILSYGVSHARASPEEMHLSALRDRIEKTLPCLDPGLEFVRAYISVSSRR